MTDEALKIKNKLAQRRCRAKNPQRARVRSKDIYLRWKYGMTLEEYNGIIKQQEGKCAICYTPLNEAKGYTHTDHDHLTGKVRGVLCQGCNIGLGGFVDDVKRLRATADYLEKSHG